MVGRCDGTMESSTETIPGRGARRVTAKRAGLGVMILVVAAIGAESALARGGSSPAVAASATAATAATVTQAKVATTAAAGSSVVIDAAVVSRPATASAAAAVTTVAATTAPTSRTLDVPVYYQAYTLSCEEAALRMALASEGIYVTDTQVLAIIGSDPTGAYWDASGLRWGDPYATFVGSVSGSETALTGYGTYYPNIARAASALGGTVLASGEDISAQAVYDYILAGHPVVAWVTYQWVNAQRADYTAYDGRVIPYAGPVEHAVTVVGVTATEVIINDPDFGRTVVSKSLFESSYATYNHMAVVLK